MPERKRLGSVVHEIKKSRRAYPLYGIAALFLAKPDYYWIKLEKIGEEQTEVDIFQCKQCSAVFLEQSVLLSHVLAKHLDDFYVEETLENEPPAGNFACVGRCSLSGELIGPPNYHGFNERIKELHRQRFANMPLEAYREKVEMVHDPELIEQWKTACCNRKVYHAKKKGAAPDAMTGVEVEAHFSQHYAGSVMKKVERATMPAKIAQDSSDQRIMPIMRAAWTRESRMPNTLAFALRPAFNHMGLYLFKAAHGETFVTPIKPRVVNPKHAVDEIKETLTFLAEHPGYNRQKLIEKLRPGIEPDSNEVTAVLSPLRWLIDKGHVIEFFDGTLSVPANRQKK